jgi:hypothetical protein
MKRRGWPAGSAADARFGNSWCGLSQAAPLVAWYLLLSHRLLLRMTFESS